MSDWTKIKNIISEFDNYCSSDGRYCYNTYPESEDTFSMYVDGDWKHDHLYAQSLVDSFAMDNGYDIELTKTVNDERNKDYGGDAYAATYYYKVNNINNVDSGDESSEDVPYSSEEVSLPDDTDIEITNYFKEETNKEITFEDFENYIESNYDIYNQADSIYKEAKRGLANLKNIAKISGGNYSNLSDADIEDIYNIAMQVKDIKSED